MSRLNEKLTVVPSGPDLCNNAKVNGLRGFILGIGGLFKLIVSYGRESNSCDGLEDKAEQIHVVE